MNKKQSHQAKNRPHVNKALLAAVSKFQVPAPKNLLQEYKKINKIKCLK